MVQANYTIENAAGAIVRANLNAALAAIQSANSGSTAPSGTRAGMLWLDTSANPPVLRIRNAGDSGWIALGTIDAAGFQLAGTTAAGRTLIGAANAGAQRTALGLGALATGTKASHRVSNPLNTDTTPWLWAGEDLAAAVVAHAPDNGIGVGQTWQDVTANRSSGVAYQNTTGRSIMVITHGTGSASLQVSNDGENWMVLGNWANNYYQRQSMIVPPSWYYQRSGLNVGAWMELR